MKVGDKSINQKVAYETVSDINLTKKRLDIEELEKAIRYKK